jgi:stage IV sporulation protein B
MTFREKWRKILLIALAISILFTAGFGYFYFKNLLPERITVVVDENGSVNLHIPIQGTLSSEDSAVALYDTSEGLTQSDTVVVGGGKTAVINASEAGSYQLVYRLFGLFNLQKIQVDAVDEQMLYPCGTTMGLYLETDGILVVGLSELMDSSGNTSSPAKGLIESGDYIIAVGDRDLTSKEDLIEAVADSGGEALKLTIRRDNETKQCFITPVDVGNEDYKLGIWVRDDCQGIGTVTYLDEDGYIGALGHGISDVDTGLRIDSHEGTLWDSQIHSILKGKSGIPGSICGTISYEDTALNGTIIANTDQGIFGILSETGIQKLEAAYADSDLTFQALPVGYQQEVTTGTAYIRSAVSGTLTDYEVRITGVDLSKSNKNKGLVLEVTDERLLDYTGGIVQGMSGSPILQNGKIIGAVTHVFVQDSTKGYGILIEKMLDAATAAEGN